jgi:hypothetical protein
MARNVIAVISDIHNMYANDNMKGIIYKDGGLL